MSQTTSNNNGAVITWHDSVWCVLYFVLSLSTDTAVPLSKDGQLRGENFTGQLHIGRNFVAIVRKV